MFRRVTMSSAMIPEYTRETSGWRRMKRPWRVNGPSLRGSRGSKIIHSPTQLVTYPITTPPIGSTHQ